jgi:hypothetical protein
MAKAVKVTPEWEENFAEFIQSVVGKIGRKSGKADVLEAIKAHHGDEAHKYAESNKGLSDAINNANKHHKYSREKSEFKKSAPSGVPSAADVNKAAPLLLTIINEGVTLEEVKNVAALLDILTLAEVEKVWGIYLLAHHFGGFEKLAEAFKPKTEEQPEEPAK